MILTTKLVPFCGIGKLLNNVRTSSESRWEGGRAWAGAKASEKLRNGEAGVCSAEAYAGAAALKDGNHEGLKVCIG